MADTKDPFAEFGGTAEPAPEPAAVEEDPFAAFGGSVEAPVSPAVEAKAEEPSALSQVWEGIKGIPEAGQTLVESVLSPLGVKAPVAAAEAALPYLKDVVTPGVKSDFGKSYDQAVQGIDERAEKFAPTAAVGRLASDVGATVATGGLGAQAIGAKVLGTQAAQKLSGTAAKLLGQKVAPLVGGALALGAEGALQGAEQAAATVIDKTIQSGDWQALGEKLYSQVPAGALEGAKWNMVTGVAAKGLGLLGRVGSKADDTLALQVDNAAAPTTQTQNVYDAKMPLRSRDIIDVGSDEAIAARKLATPEIAKELQEEAVKDLEPMLNRREELRVGLEEGLRKAVKKQYVRGFQDDWTGPSFREVLGAQGITREGLEELAKRDPDSTSKINRLVKIFDNIESELPTGATTAPGLRFQAPAPGSRIKTATPALGDDAYQNLSQLGDYSKSLEGALAAPASSKSRGPTTGEMYNALDEFKGGLQRLVASKSRGLAHETLKGPGEALRNFLEDPTKVNKTLADGQKAINGELSPYIDLQRQADEVANVYASGRVKAGRTNHGDLGGDPYDTPYVADPDKLRGVLGSLGLSNELAEETFRAEGRQAVNSFGERLRWAGESDPALRKDLAEFLQLNTGIENTFNRVGLANRYAAENAAKATGDGLAPLVAGGLVGATTATLLGPVGGTVAAGAGAFAGKKAAEGLKAWKTAKNAQRSGAALGLKKATIKTQERLDKAVRKVRLYDAAEEAVDTVRAPLIMEDVQRDVTKEIEKIDQRRDEKSDEYKKTLSRMDEIRSHAGEELARAYASQLDRRDSFLLDKAGLPPRSTVFGTEKRELDDDTAAAVHRAKVAADDPIAAIERVGAGRGSMEDIEALEALYPSLYSEWKGRVVDDLAASKKKPTAEQAEILASILGVGFLPESDAASIGFYQGLASTGADESNSGKSQRQYKGNSEAVRSKGDRLG